MGIFISPPKTVTRSTKSDSSNTLKQTPLCQPVSLSQKRAESASSSCTASRVNEIVYNALTKDFMSLKSLNQSINNFAKSASFVEKLAAVA